MVGSMFGFTRRRFLTLSGMLACGCAARAPFQPSAATRFVEPPFSVIDTMPAFWAFWERARAKSPEEAFALFEQTVLARHRPLYAPDVIGLEPEDGALRERFMRWFPELPQLVPTMRALGARFEARLSSGTERFMRELPRFSWDGDCYLMVSLDAFNGAGREVSGAPALLFGLDVVAKMRPDSDLMVFLHHELFHFHQTEQSVWNVAAAMWMEGLATYASRVLNPGTGLDDALPLSHLHDPADPQLVDSARAISFEHDMPRHEQDLGMMLLDKLRSEDEADYATFFLGRASNALGERPVRSGYYFGLRVVEELAAGRTLQELSLIDSALIIDEIEAALRSVVGAAASRERVDAGHGGRRSVRT